MLKKKDLSPKSPSISPVNIGVFEACIIGLVAALGAVLLKEGVGYVGTWRVQKVAEFGPYVLPLIGMAGGLISGLIVHYVAPEIRGSGIAQTKGNLSGADIPLGLRTAASLTVIRLCRHSIFSSVWAMAETHIFTHAFVANLCDFHDRRCDGVAGAPLHRDELVQVAHPLLHRVLCGAAEEPRLAAAAALPLRPPPHAVQ